MDTAPVFKIYIKSARMRFHILISLSLSSPKSPDKNVKDKLIVKIKPPASEHKKNIYKLFTDNAVFQRFVDLTIYNTQCPQSEIWLQR